MSRPRKAAAGVAVLLVAGLATAGGAAAHGGEHKAGAEPRGGGLGKGGAGGGHFCDISADRLLTADDNAALAKLKARLDKRVAEQRMSEERADRIYARAQKRVTVRVTRLTALRAPVLELFGMTQSEFRAAVREDGLRALLEDKGVTRREYRSARRQAGRKARDAVRELCASGSPEAGAEDAPAT